MKTQGSVKASLMLMATFSFLLITVAACSNYATDSGDGSSLAKENQAVSTDSGKQVLPAAVTTPQGDQMPSTNLSPCDPAPHQNYTPEQVGQRAASCHSATLLLAQSVTLSQVADMGLGCYNFSSIETPPLVLVILKGNFSAGNRIGSIVPSAQSSAKYMALVYDMWAGTPAIVVTSPNGGGFRKALNDPTLPDDAPPGSPTPQPVPCSSDNTGKHLHYGQTAP